MKTNLHIRMMAMGLFVFLFAGNNLTAQTDWVKYENNPVFQGFAGGPYSTLSPALIYEGGIFKMWYSGRFSSSEGYQIFYTESIDGINWIENANPVIQSGEQGEWNQNILPGCVLSVDDTLRMWFTGGTGAIGYAWWSEEHSVWNVLPDPVIEKGDPGSWNETGVYRPSVIFDGSTYHMWYNGFEGTSDYDPDHVGYATSTNGIDWDEYSENPVLSQGPDDTFYDTWIMSSCVLFIDNVYHMWFGGWDGTSTNPFKYIRIGYATSQDGIDWTVENDGMPVLDVGEEGTWDSNWIRYSSVMLHGDTLKMWYDGSNDGYTKIGYAKADYYIPGVSDLNSILTKQITVYPNPCKDDVKLTYHLAIRSKVSLEIYNQFGQLISVLVDETKQAGEHEVIFEIMELLPGVYFCVLKANDEIQTAKIVKL